MKHSTCVPIVNINGYSRCSKTSHGVGLADPSRNCAPVYDSDVTMSDYSTTENDPNNETTNTTNDINTPITDDSSTNASN